MKKNVVIITWCMTSLNYGETLQAFALNHILKKMNLDPVVVSYVETSPYGLLYNLLKSSICGTIAFSLFLVNTHTNLKFCFSKSDVEQVVQGKDIIIVGSDQVWNPNYVRDSSVFSLDLKGDFLKKIAYAPSFGVKYFHRNNYNKVNSMCEMINKIDYVSCREKLPKGIILEKKVCTVLDPTLLLNKSEWIKLQGKRKRKRKRYVLVYLLGDIIQYQDLIVKTRKKYNAEEIVLIDIEGRKKIAIDKICYKYAVSPNDFLSYIYYAEAVLTDSFHGVIFSINFSKNFICVTRKYRKYQIEPDIRIIDILNRFHIQERLVNNEKDIDNIANSIDYKEVNIYLNKERELSFRFLYNAVGMGDINE